MARRTKQRVIVLETELPVPPWRKADVTHHPQRGTRVERYETPLETKLERGMVGLYLCSHDRDRRPLTGPWNTAEAGTPIRCTLVNQSGESKKLSIKLFVTEDGP